MAIKPGQLRKVNKNPPFFSHEFFITNHADIVSCLAMMFVIGIMFQITSSFASIFIGIHHNITEADYSPDNERSDVTYYEVGWKDWCGIFFYMLICIISHAALQEYILDRISKKQHFSKYKLARFNDSGQLVVFYGISLLWCIYIVTEDGYLGRLSQLYIDYPDHPLLFRQKLFYIIQLAYYFHQLPEMYFQRIKKDDQQQVIIHSFISSLFIGSAYILSLHRCAVCLLTLHYISEVSSHAFNLLRLVDRTETYLYLHAINDIIFVLIRFVTVIFTVLTLYYGIDGETTWSVGMLSTISIVGLQLFIIVNFLTMKFRINRERLEERMEQQRKTVTNRSKRGYRMEERLDTKPVLPKKLK